MKLIPHAALLTALAFANAALADEPPAPPAGDQAAQSAPIASEPEPWRIEVHPGIWYVGFSGDLKLPRSSGGANVTTDIDQLELTGPRIAPYGEATLRRGRWLASLRGFVFSADAQAQQTASGNLGNIDFNSGDSIKSSLDVATVELMGGYEFLLTEREAMTGGGYKLRFGIDGLVGARLLDFDYQGTLVGSGVSSGHDEFTAHPMAGVRMHADFYEQFTVTLEVSAGGLPLGDDSSYGFDIVVGGQWRPIQHVGVQIGYRALFMGLKSGSDNEQFDYSGAGQGLFAGVTFSF
ncbi:MAG: hypothetical protein JSR77_10330 [Planctomycetes bacterium]|nr:hypothetical protein [Planctomycetota bacterium]